MKNITIILFAAAFFIASCGPTRVIQTESYQPAPEPAPVPVAAVSYQSFYDDLAPYGSWINYPGYGYVWMPNAGPDFVPYNTNGNWIYTEAGWTWASNYNWGWAPFHYGRWFYEGGYGWMWVPGNEWAPAWVSWRGDNDYYGWAPLGPNVSIDVALGSYNPPMNYWNFVPRRYMGNPQWHNYYVDRSRNVTIINNTTIINNYSGTNRARYAYAPGPDPVEVRRVSGANIQPVRIREANTPGSRVNGNQFDIYRPRIDATPSNRNNAAARPAPARVQEMRDVRPQVQNPNNNNNNNGRPVLQPSNNTRPATRPPVQNPVNNNPRPAIQNPNNERPALPPSNNARPATQPAVQNPVNNNPRPAFQNPNNGRPVLPPSNNARPVAQPAPVNASPANTGRPADSRFNRTPANTQPAQQRTLPQPSPANRAQMHTQPAANTQASHPQPVRRVSPAQQKPGPVVHRAEEKKAEKPKTRDAN
jgi:hypothetical protein